MPAFSHLDAGTPEAVWLADPRTAGVPELELEVDELIVLAAHPDDETLGAAGLMNRVHRGGGRVTVIVATDGEASHPDSPTHTPGRLAALRRTEVGRAVESLAGGARVEFLGIPDGALRENIDALADSLTMVLEELDVAPSREHRVAIAAPWAGDGHRDHRIAAEAVARVCEGRGIRHLGYPIWLWHWGTPDDMPWDSARALTLTRSEITAKRRALGVHATQVAPLSPAAGDEAVIHRDMRAHFERGVEVFIDESRRDSAPSLAGEWFDRFYERHDDPWGFETRWYEKRKRGILMSALPNAHLGDVLEIGCATGLVTRELVARASHVVAVDPAEAALQAARARLGEESRVTFVHGLMPRDWPDGTFDTVVLSEVGYYLSADDLDGTIRLVEGCLSDDGCLVACHWRHPVADYPQTGDVVHAALRQSTVWEALVRHEERDFILEVFCRAPVHSVAEREGLL
ncbi:bifunctional PIG-L family deacetylase/class I SAM-dependent methyltransferase [Microbacterium deminutum]|uniref:Methyltransferase domain-containing protein n=1 Tax=Microbacterium deminutum TaxID=344164 RepID=A0ABN2QHH6_9MICO